MHFYSLTMFPSSEAHRQSSSLERYLGILGGLALLAIKKKSSVNLLSTPACFLLKKFSQLDIKTTMFLQFCTAWWSRQRPDDSTLGKGCYLGSVIDSRAHHHEKSVLTAHLHLLL